ncbi:RES family NAD+ phosphorylase [Niabella terrae]
MNVFRITQNRHLSEDLRGIGASLYPGRWNKKDIPCIYTAESRALALVEHMANVTKATYIGSSFTLRNIFVPDELIVKISTEMIPANWRDKPPPMATRVFGTELLQSKKGLAYILPSVVIPQEFNIIIDPTHHAIENVLIINDEPLAFDLRLKQ